MATKKAEHVTSKYKYVTGIYTQGKTYWRMGITGTTNDSFESEREAAIAVDKKLIEQGKEPVNILTRR